MDFFVGMCDDQGDPELDLVVLDSFEGNRDLSSPHSCDHCRNPQEIHDTGHVVGQNMQCHLCRNVFESAHLEVGRTHP